MMLVVPPPPPRNPSALFTKKETGYSRHYLLRITLFSQQYNTKSKTQTKIPSPASTTTTTTTTRKRYRNTQKTVQTIEEASQKWISRV